MANNILEQSTQDCTLSKQSRNQLIANNVRAAAIVERIEDAVIQILEDLRTITQDQHTTSNILLNKQS